METPTSKPTFDFTKQSQRISFLRKRAAMSGYYTNKAEADAFAKQLQSETNTKRITVEPVGERWIIWSRREERD